MRYLVTGGAGFLGSHLVDSLVAQGEEVTIIDNFHRGHLDNLHNHLTNEKVNIINADVRDYPRVLEAISGSEVVFHLAAQSNVMGAISDLDYSFTSNVLGTFNILKAASAEGVRRIVFASSREVYGEPSTVPVHESAPLLPKNPYGASKVAGEAYCRIWNKVDSVDCLILRFANLYGPRDRDRVIPHWLHRAQSGSNLEMYGGQQILDFLWVSYAVEALLASASCRNEGPINVGSGCGISLKELAQRVLSVTGSRSEIECLPSREVEVMRFVADVSLMQRVLGINPPQDSLDGLAILAAEDK